MKFWNNVAAIVAIILVVILANAPILITIFAPTPLVYPRQPLKINKAAYVSDDNLTIWVYRCNYEKQPLVITAARSFYNMNTGQTVPLPPSSSIAQVGCAEASAEILDIFPDSMPTGLYVMRGTTTARGSLKTVDVYWQTDTFQFTNTH